MLDIITGHLIGELASSAATLFGPGIQSRAQRRTIDAEQRVEAARLNRRLTEIAAEQQARDLELDRLLRQQYEAATYAQYPLGTPGRIRELLRPGPVPSLLISPTYSIVAASPLAVAESVNRILNTIDGASQFVRSIVGGFAHDGPTVREIRGNLGSQEIANREFRPHPSLIVHFADTGDGVTAHAMVADFFPTSTGESAFETPIARLSGSVLEFAVWQDPEGLGPNLCWSSLSAAEMNDVDLIATAISLFTITVSAIYWRLHGVRWSVLKPALTTINKIFDEANKKVIATVPERLTRAERLEQELTELAARHRDLQILDENPLDDALVVFVFLEKASIAFFLDEAYPSRPPDILITTGEAVQPVNLGSSHWDPSHSLVELVEALT